MATTPLAQRLYDKTGPGIIEFRQYLADWHARQIASGFVYGGSAIDIYWAMCREHLWRKVTEYFELIEKEAREISQSSLRRESIEQCVSAIVAYSRQVRSASIEKDRIMQGLSEGCDSGRWGGLDDQAISDRGLKLIAALGLGRESKINERLNHFVRDNPWFFSLLSVLSFIISLIALYLTIATTSVNP